MAYIDTFLKSPDLATMMNKAIKVNKANGIYDGCKKAVELAVSLGKSAKAKAKSPARPSKSPQRTK